MKELRTVGQGHTFVTFCNYGYSHYLEQLARSLDRVAETERSFRLVVYSLDEATLRFSESLASKVNNVEITACSVEDISDTRVMIMKKDRPFWQFCWGIAPFVVMNELKRSNSLTYVDADMYFISCPGEYLDRCSREKKVLLTPHFHSNPNMRSASHGKYCVQFMYFPRTSVGEMILSEWANDCFRSSGISIEEGVYGDQLYLDKWPSRYGSDIRCEEECETFVGPWNSSCLSDKTIAVHLHAAHHIRLFKSLNIFIGCSSRYPIGKRHRKILEKAGREILESGLSPKKLRKRTLITYLIKAVLSKSPISFRIR